MSNEIVKYVGYANNKWIWDKSSNFITYNQYAVLELGPTIITN